MEREEPFIYDEASRHYDGDWPEGLPHKQAYVHTGFYLGWIIANGLASATFVQHYAAQIEAFQCRAMTGPQVYERIGGIFTADMLNDEGRAFTETYFHFGKGLYLQDYGHLLADFRPTAYHVEDKWSHYERIATRIGLQYKYWKSRRDEDD